MTVLHGSGLSPVKKRKRLPMASWFGQYRWANSAVTMAAS